MSKYKFEVYTSLVTDSHVYIMGRLLVNNGIKLSEGDGYLTSLLKSLVRSMSKEIKRQAFTATIGGHEHNLVTDKEGYFELLEKVVKHYHTNETAILFANIEGHDVQHSCELTQYKSSMPVGIISDVDDTILITRVKSFFKLRMIFNSLFVNPFRRSTIEHAATYYKRVIKNEDGQGPIIYISNSPWNMYNYLQTFLAHNNFPKGELQLRDFGLQMLQKKKPLEFQNKYIKIEQVLTIFSKTTFILVGDSAEKDYDIYTKIRYKYPERVKKIVIIKAGNASNEKRIEQMMDSADPNVLLIEAYKQLDKLSIN